MENLLIISDVHARYSQLKELIQLSNINNSKTIFLGDYVGYGESPLETIRYVKHLQEEHDAILLLGNWEDMLYKAFQSPTKEERDMFIKTLYKRGAKSLFQLLNQDKQIKNEVLTFIESLKSSYIFQDLVFAHAGVNWSKWHKNMSIQEFVQENTIEELVWNEGFWSSEFPEDTPFFLIVGHVPVQVLRNSSELPKPLIYKNTCCIDFGASRKSGYLGAFTCTSQKFDFISVPITK